MSPVFVKSHTPDLWLKGATTAEYRPLSEEIIPRPIIVRLDTSLGRFDHLDLGFYRRTIPQRDFAFLIAFTGGDTFGFTDQDLEVFYPPEE